MSDAISVAGEQAIWRPAANPWLIAVTVSMAAFMEVLDTAIANVALPHIAGNLGASNDQSTWVLTSYLVANAIVLPITGWLVSVFGRKRFFMTCMCVFTVSSLLCGIAPNLVFLLLFRVLQGAGGGGLQPMAQAILADTFPPSKRGLAFSIYGITAVCAPAIGPTLGGWLTDNTSWRWIFLINLPVGLLTLALVWRLIEDPPHMVRRKRSETKLDYVGFSLLALGVGALQIMLDKGQEDDWFGSDFIMTLAITAGVCLTALIIYEWFHADPIVDVRLFRNANFATANMMMFMVGAISFATTVLMPQFLQTLMGYTAQSARNGPLSGGPIALGRVAVRRPSDRKLPVALSNRVRLDHFGHRHVCFHAKNRSADQLPIRDTTTHRPVFADGFRLCPSHDGGLHRN
jgi:DHA2 family multidrug resistance protein